MPGRLNGQTYFHSQTTALGIACANLPAVPAHCGGSNGKPDSMASRITVT
jgi:hypothetical protein